METNYANKLQAWLLLLDGPESLDEAARQRAIAEMRRAGSDRLFPHFAPMLADGDREIRCRAALAILLVNTERGQKLVLPLLNDVESTVRWHVCGCLHDLGDERAVDALVNVLRCDPDTQVRGTAAYALGGIGSPAAIPALLVAMDNDHEKDELGHTPSHTSACALDEILGANKMHIRVSESVRRLPLGSPDFERLRRMATALFERWIRQQDARE